MTREQIRAQVADTRARQGLGPTITDPAVLRQLAVEVADVLVRQQGATDNNDAGPRATRRRSAGARRRRSQTSHAEA
jgi:hypothetical protein